MLWSHVEHQLEYIDILVYTTAFAKVKQNDYARMVALDLLSISNYGWNFLFDEVKYLLDFYTKQDVKEYNECFHKLLLKYYNLYTSRWALEFIFNKYVNVGSLKDFIDFLMSHPEHLETIYYFNHTHNSSPTIQPTIQPTINEYKTIFYSI